MMVKLRFIILIDFVKTYGYLPSTIGQYPPTRNSIERQSSLVSPEGMVPQERMYLSQFRWLGQPFPLLFLLTLAKKKKKSNNWKHLREYRASLWLFCIKCDQLSFLYRLNYITPINMREKGVTLAQSRQGKAN